MARVLVLGKASIERDARALILEFAEHHCTIAGSIREFEAHLEHGKFDLALIDSPYNLCYSEILLLMETIAPKLPVMGFRNSRVSASEQHRALLEPCAPQTMIQLIERTLSRHPPQRSRKTNAPLVRLGESA